MRRLCLSCLTALLIACGCSFQETENPPYIVSNLVCVAGANEGYYRYSGVNVNFYSTGKKPITGMKISFIVYDPQTKKNPFYGSNIIKFKYSGSIAPNVETPLAISLDPYVFSVPKEPYLIDMFTISKITYSDGSVWEDQAGVFYTRSY